jgi:SAM-dependent methyltransferase
MEYPGLDDAFIHYIRATPERTRRIQGFYVPFFAGCQDLVVDLACGHGHFVELLTEHGIDALGVDSDPACCAQVRQRGLKIECSDVVDYLQRAEESSLAGIFSSHLVEHLPYQKVMELIQLSYRALRPGGIIVLVTPNVRGLYPHLESFYMHFGHVTFYHPRLLGFFLDYFGFADPRAGENPQVAHPLWRDTTWGDPDETAGWKDSDPALVRPVRYDSQLPSRYRGVLGRLFSAVKMLAAHLVVQPLLDQVVKQTNRSLYELTRYVQQLNANVNDTHRRLMALDRGVECYVYATKGEGALDLPPELVGEPL